MKNISLATVLALALMLILPNSILAQERASYLDVPGSVLLPRDFDTTKTYPLMIWLPFTTGQAQDFFASSGLTLATLPIIHYMPEGRTQSTDYLPDFMKFVGWYDERIKADLATIQAAYPIDPTKIAIGGFSLGGDLSWALVQRNPTIFSGAVMAGTRASYGTTRAIQATLKAKGFRASFIIGSREDPNRYQGIRRAWTAFQQGGIETKYFEVEGAGHSPGPAEYFMEQMLWAIGWTGRTPPISETPDWGATQRRIRSILEAPPSTTTPTATNTENQQNKDALPITEFVLVETNTPKSNRITLRVINETGASILSIGENPPNQAMENPIHRGWADHAPLPAGHEFTIVMYPGTFLSFFTSDDKSIATPRITSSGTLRLRPNGQYTLGR